MIKIITEKHRLVLSSFVIEELSGVMERKFPGKKEAIDQFLSEFPYEMVYTPKEMAQGLFQIRDKKDYPVLYTAIIADVDVFISGDKDFFDIDIEKPEILTPAQFLAKYC
jgi:predicted nucleic acid-binding protein